MYNVYFIKHLTKLTMRYGQYFTEKEAFEALRHASSWNTTDSFYIEKV